MAENFNRLTALRQAIPQQRLGGADLLQPESDEVTSQRSFDASFGIINDAAIVARAVDSLTEDRGEIDVNLQPGTELKNSEEFAWILDAMAEDPDLFDNIHDARNLEDMFNIARAYRARLEAFSDAIQNPVSAGAGAVLGIAFSPSSYLPVGILKGFTALKLAATTAKNARAIAFTRLGVLEGSTQAGLVGVEGISDPSIGQGEIALGGALGGLIGGAIGAAAPKVAFVRRTVDEVRTASAPKALNRSTTSKEAPEAPVVPEPEAKAGGAQTTPEPNELLVPEAGPARALGSGKGKNILGFETFRGIKQRMQNILSKFDPGTKENKGVTDYVALMGLIVNFDQPLVGEVRGLTSRVGNVAKNKVVDWEEAIKGKADADIVGAYNDLAKEAPELMKRGRNQIIKGRDRFGFGKRGLLKRKVTKKELDYLHTVTLRRMDAGQDIEEAAEQVILANFDDVLDAGSHTALKKAIVRSANAQDGMFKEMGQKTIDSGIEGSDGIDLSKPFIPQAYNTPKVLAVREELIDLRMELMRGNPPQEFIDAVAENFADDVENFFENVNVGDKFKDLSRNDQESLISMVTGKLQEVGEEMAEAGLKKAKKALKVKKGQSINIVMQAHEERLGVAQAAVDKTKNLLARRVKKGSKLKTSKTDILRKLKKQEEDLNTMIKDRDDAVAGLSRKACWERILKQTASEGPIKFKDAASKALRAQKKASAAVGKAIKTQKRALKPLPDLKQLATDQVDSISGSLDAKESVFGFDMGVQKPGQTARLIPRQLDWSEAIKNNHPLMDEIFINDGDTLGNSFIQQVGTRVEFKNLLGDADPTELLNKTVRELPKELQEQANADVGVLIDTALGRHQLKGFGATQGIRYASGVIKNFTASTLLGGIALTLPGDIGITHLSRELAQGPMGETLKGLIGVLTPKQLRGKNAPSSILDVIIGMEKNSLAVLLAGARNIGNVGVRQKQLFDISAPGAVRGLGIPGSFMWKATTLLQAGAEKTSDLMMVANGMNYWNSLNDLMLRSSAIDDVIRLGKGGWDAVPADMQAIMRSAGLNETKLKRITELFNKHNVEVEGAILPDIDNWPKAAQLDMMRFVENRQAMGIITPELGDMPRLASDPIGTMAMHLTGFGFAAQQKVARRMRQKGWDNPVVIQSLMFMFFASTISTAARMAGTGRGDELDFSDPENLSNFITETFLRSPLNVGGASMWIELAINLGGSPTNALLEKAGLPQLAPENAPFRTKSPLASFLGPGIGAVQNLLTSSTEAAEDLVEGDVGGAASELGGALPFNNHLLLQLYGGLFEE